MTWLDVALPGGLALLMLLAPQHWFTKRTADPARFARAAAVRRTVGAILLVLTGVYLVVKLVTWAGVR